MKRKILEILLITALYFPVSSFMYSMTAVTSESVVPMMLNYIAIAVPQILILIYLLFVQREPLASYGIRPPRPATLGWMGIGLVGALCTMILVLMIISLIPQAKDLLKEQKIDITSYAQLPLVLIFCLAVGFREELFFRAYLITRLESLGVHPGWALVASSFIFGMAHFSQGLVGILVIFAIGMLLGGIFLFKRDLTAVAGAHALYNFSLFLIALAGKQT